VAAVILTIFHIISTGKKKPSNRFGVVRRSFLVNACLLA